jgi:hypothetical protein
LYWFFKFYHITFLSLNSVWQTGLTCVLSLPVTVYLVG